MQSLHSLPPEVVALLDSMADRNSGLKAALEDYEEARTRASDDRATTEERAEWAEIRDELKLELMRFAKRLNHDRRREPR